MLQRYLDAATAFNTILGYIARCTHSVPKNKIEHTQWTWRRIAASRLSLSRHKDHRRDNISVVFWFGGFSDFLQWRTQS